MIPSDMKKRSADTLIPINLKVPPELRAQVAALATKAGQPESAVIRAAVRYAMPLLTAQPQLVAQLDAGAVPESQAAALVQRVVSLAEKHAVPADTVLAASLRTGFQGLERRLDLDGQVIRAIASGFFEHPAFMKIIDQMNQNVDVTEKLLDEAAAKIGRKNLPIFPANTPPAVVKQQLDEAVARHRKKSGWRTIIDLGTGLDAPPASDPAAKRRSVKPNA